MREPTREEWKSWAAEIERPSLEAEKKAKDASWQALLAGYQAQTMFHGQVHISMQMPCPHCGRYYSDYGGSIFDALGLGGMFG